jgi:hypothetical protein
MKTIGILLIGFFIPLMASAKAPKLVRTVTKQELKLLNEKIKKPDFVVEMMNTVKTRGSQINILRRHISVADLRALKQQGDLLKVNFRNRLKINLHDSNSFSFEDKTKVFKFSPDGRAVLLGASVFKIDRKQSLLTNYKAISAQLKAKGRVSASCQIFSCAYAVSSEDSMAYDLTTLLYYMDVHNTGDGNVMWDYFTEEPAVQAASANMTKFGKTIRRMSCDEIGISIEYSDESKSYLTWNGKEGAEFEMKINESEGTNALEETVSGVDKVIAGNAWFYYCTKLNSPQRDNIVQLLNMNFLSPQNVQENHIEQ